MRKTILTCDRCKKEVDVLIDVGAGERRHSLSSYRGDAYEVYQLSAEWCLNCCIEMHIAKPSKGSDPKPIDPAPTLEDMVREIVREEISN